MFSLPMLLVFPLIGVVADRFNRQHVAVYCDFLAALLTFGLWLALDFNSLPLIFALLFIRSAVAKFFAPAESALLQGVLDEEHYAAAAGLNQAVTSLFLLFGSALGMAVYWHFGVQGAMLVDLVSFLLSGMLIAFCRLDRDVLLPNGTSENLTFASIREQFTAGIRYLMSSKLLVMLSIGFFLMGVVNGGFSVFITFMLKYRLVPNDYEQWSIYANMVFGVGILLGSIGGSLLVTKLKPYYLLSLGLIVAGLLLTAIAFVQTIAAFLTISFLIALAIACVNVAFGGWLPALVDAKFIGRVQGVIAPLSMASHSGTLLLISLTFPVVLGLTEWFLILALLLTAIGLFFFVTLPRYAPPVMRYNEAG